MKPTRTQQTCCGDARLPKHIKLPVLGGFLILLCLSGWAAQAEYPPIYDVEIVVFRNLSPDDGGERWNTPDMYRGGQRRHFPQDEFTELAYRLYQMKGITRALENSRNYEVLYHRAWRQLAYNRRNSVAYPVETEIENGKRNSVQGRVRLIRERFLHLDVELFLMAIRGQASTLVDSRIPLFELNEKRRIRSGELHYFDHPRFGMIARITPYRPSEAPAETPDADAPVTGWLSEGGILARLDTTASRIRSRSSAIPDRLFQ
ncbi:MAG: hypothetical protein HKM88_00120 [Halobacteria archaeon]|nr:hypothetical protein [Halobacteria archaeon]